MTAALSGESRLPCEISASHSDSRGLQHITLTPSLAATGLASRTHRNSYAQIPLLQPRFEQKEVADQVCNFFSAENLVADLVVEQVAVMEFVHYKAPSSDQPYLVTEF